MMFESELRSTFLSLVHRRGTAIFCFNVLHLKGLCQLGGMRNRVPALTEQFEIVVPTFSNTGEVRKPFPSA